MRKLRYEYHEETGEVIPLAAATTEEAKEEARQLIREGDWGVSECEGGRTRKTIYPEARVVVLDENNEELDQEYVEERIDPDPVFVDGCEDHTEEDWGSPYDLVGGIAENPGVWGSAGGVVIREVCRRCGIYRIRDTWDQQVGGDGQPRESIQYEAATPDSLRWAAKQHKDSTFIRLERTHFDIEEDTDFHALVDDLKNDAGFPNVEVVPNMLSTMTVDVDANIHKNVEDEVGEMVEEYIDNWIEEHEEGDD